MKTVTRVTIFCFLLMTFAVSAESFAASKAAATAVQNPPIAASAAAWQKRWDDTLAAAVKEGELLLYLNGPVGARVALQDAFKKKFGITLNVVVGSGSVVSSRLNTEYQSGIHQVDVLIAGASSSIMARKQGFLAPVASVFILPEISNPAVWTGQKLPTFDKEGMVFPFLSQAIPPIIYNRNMVKEGQITTHLDLLKPEWKDKLVMFDPTISGSSHAWAGRLTQAVGVEKANEFFTALVKQQNVMVTREMGQQMEWVSRGKYPLAIFPQTPAVSQFISIGAPIAAATFRDMTGVSPSNGVLALPKYPAHPNAAVIFTNWLLSKEGQELAVKCMDLPSARVDVPPEGVDPMFIVKPGSKLYIQDEAFELQVEVWSPAWKKIFAQAR